MSFFHEPIAHTGVVPFALLITQILKDVEFEWTLL